MLLKIKNIRLTSSFLLLFIVIFCLSGSPLFAKWPATNSGLKILQQAMGTQYKAGDALQILTYPDTASIIHGTYPIDGDGNIYLPITGKVQITKMKEDELKQYLQSSLEQYFRFPNLQFRYLMRVSLLGGFQTPGMFYVDPGETLWQLISRAGGTVQGDALEDMVWERNNEVIRTNLVSLMESTQPLSKIGFRSGDQIHVPSPADPTWWDRVLQITPLITVAATVYTVYMTYQREASLRERGF